MIKLDISKALENAAQAVELKEQVAAAQEALENGTCPGNDFLGWLHLPSSITAEFLNEIKACAEVLFKPLFKARFLFLLYTERLCRCGKRIHA